LKASWSFSFAVFAAFFTCHAIKGGAGAFPDADEFARGSSCWSSSVACGLGKYQGRDGLMFGCALAASCIVYWVARMGGLRALFYLCIACFTPFAWSLFGAGADSLGAMAVLLAIGGRYRGLGGVFVCFFHLASGLSFLGALFARRLGVRIHTSYLMLLAGLGEVIVLRVHGFLGSVSEPTEMQWRYLLPGVVLLVVKFANDRAKSSRLPKVVYSS
jgi:uncharacterized membrane protein